VLHTETCGDGAPLVMLHGWGLNLRVFDGLAAVLAQRWRVIRIDLPGHGRSAWPGSLAREGFADAVREHVPRQAVLCGWSLGGQLALQLAAEAALQVRALVLLHATPRFQRSADWAFGMPPEVMANFARQLALDYERTVADFLSLQVRGSADAPQALAALRLALLEHGAADPRALRFALEWLAQADLRALCPALPQPALVVAGQYDRVTPPQAQRALTAALRAARLVEIRRAGHAAFLSHPQELQAAVVGFLGALRGAAEAPLAAPIGGTRGH